MVKSSRLLDSQTRRSFLYHIGLGGTAAMLLGAPAHAQTAPQPAEPDPSSEFDVRMRRLNARPVNTSRTIGSRTGRMPAIVVMDDEGQYIYGRLDFEGGPFSVPQAGVNRGEDDVEWIAAQHQFTASTTKVIALLAAIDWVKEEAAKGPQPHDAEPRDALLHPGLAQYSRVLGRRVSLSPRINTGGIMFHRDIDPRGTVSELSVDEVLRFAMLFSTNDLLAYLNRFMGEDRNGGRSLNQRMADVCRRLNMTDSTFPTVHGMSSAEGRARIDCRSTAAEMIHALRVLDNAAPEFAPYVQQVCYYPENPALAALREPGQMRPVTQYIEGPGRITDSRVVQVAATVNQPLYDDTGRDLNAAYVPPPAAGEDPIDTTGSTESQEAPPPSESDGPDEPVATENEAEDAGPIGGYQGVRMLKSGQLGVEKVWRGRGRRRRLVWLPRAQRTSWRTTVGMASRVIDGVERKIYFWTSSDASDQRRSAIQEALREGFSRVEIRARLARSEPPLQAPTQANTPSL